MRLQTRRLLFFILIAICWSLSFPFSLHADQPRKPEKSEKPIQSSVLDKTFGVENLVLTSIGKGEDHGEVVVVQRDSKIVVAGVTNWQGRSDIAVVRYQPSGEIDQSFGTDGKVTTDLGGQERVYGLAIQQDGRIIVAGYTKTKKEADFALVRYNPDGSLDLSFGKEGVVLTDVGGDDEIHYLVLQPDGFIVVAGFSSRGENSNFVVARYQPKGVLDPSFGGKGWIVSDFTNDDRLYGLTLQKDGKIVAAGSIFFSQSEDDCVVVRYSPDGTLDESFGEKGLSIVQMSQKQDMCSSVTVQNDGKIIVAGFAIGKRNKADMAVARVDSSGKLDPSFGSKGFVLVDFKRGADVAHAITLWQDQYILIAGESQELSRKNGTGKTHFAAGCFHLNGRLDEGFAKDGKLVIDFGGPKEAIASAMTLESNGKVLLAGHAKENFALARIGRVH